MRSKLSQRSLDDAVIKRVVSGTTRVGKPGGMNRVRSEWPSLRQIVWKFRRNLHFPGKKDRHDLGWETRSGRTTKSQSEKLSFRARQPRERILDSMVRGSAGTKTIKITILTKIGSNRSTGIEHTALPASRNSCITSSILFRMTRTTRRTSTCGNTVRMYKDVSRQRSVNVKSVRSYGNNGHNHGVDEIRLLAGILSYYLEVLDVLLLVIPQQPARQETGLSRSCELAQSRVTNCSTG